MPSRDLKKKAIPRFRSEKQEREFWSKHDSSEYVDWREAQRET
ncbi:MAG: CopG family antitoxin, partial [Candidatus Binatia bacterium]